MLSVFFVKILFSYFPFMDYKEIRYWPKKLRCFKEVYGGEIWAIKFKN
jgi:hypothetical protein